MFLTATATKTTPTSGYIGDPTKYSGIFFQFCVNPKAPEVECYICTKLVKTCSAGGEHCPVHPNGIEIGGGEWVCSETCHRKYKGQQAFHSLDLAVGYH